MDEDSFICCGGLACAESCEEKLVKAITDQAPRDWRAAAFLLARSWPSEYGQRVEITETAEPRTVGCSIFYDTQGMGMDRLLRFPKHQSLIVHERELAAEQANANAKPDDDAVTEAPESEISEEGPPPQSAPKFLTGRIPESWKKKTANGQP